MSKYGNIVWIALVGSIWGAVELFGGDLFRAWGVPHKSALLFSLALLIMYASKRICEAAGSTIIMGLIAAAFKTVSDHFYPCQVAAIMINSIIFESAYLYLRQKFAVSLAVRTIAAPIITYISYTLFAFVATYLIRQENWVDGGVGGIIDYLTSSAVFASLLSLLTINLGHSAGEKIRRSVFIRQTNFALNYLKIVMAALALAIWITGLRY